MASVLLLRKARLNWPDIHSCIVSIHGDRTIQPRNAALSALVTRPGRRVKLAATSTLDPDVRDRSECSVPSEANEERRRVVGSFQLPRAGCTPLKSPPSSRRLTLLISSARSPGGG